MSLAERHTARLWGWIIYPRFRCWNIDAQTILYTSLPHTLAFFLHFSLTSIPTSYSLFTADKPEPPPPLPKNGNEYGFCREKMKSNKDTSHHWIFSPLFILSVLLFFVMYSPTLWFKNVAKINEKIYICRSRDSITGKEQETSKEMARDKKCTWWIKEQLGIKKRRQIYNLHLDYVWNWQKKQRVKRGELTSTENLVFTLTVWPKARKLWRVSFIWFNQKITVTFTTHTCNSYFIHL